MSRFTIQLLAACPNLRRINDQTLTVDEICTAIAARGTKTQKKNMDFLRWDIAFANAPILKGIAHLRNLQKWIRGNLK